MGKFADALYILDRPVTSKHIDDIDTIEVLCELLGYSIEIHPMVVAGYINVAFNQGGDSHLYAKISPLSFVQNKLNVLTKERLNKLFELRSLGVYTEVENFSDVLNLIKLLL